MMYRKRNDLIFFLGTSVLFFLITSILYFLIDYYNDQNMINNGYINEEALHIIEDDPDLTDRLNQLLEQDDPLLILQYVPENPQIKHVFTNNEDINLPPFKNENTDSRIKDPERKSCVAVQGKASTEDTPCEIIDQFNAPNSYHFLHETWVFPAHDWIEDERGEAFVILSPEKDPNQLWSESVDEPLNEWNVVDIEEAGSYGLRSNQMLHYVLHVGAGFIISGFFLILTLHFRYFRPMISILHIYGGSILEIWRTVFLKPLIWFIAVTILAVYMLYIAINFTFELWEQYWHYRSIIIAMAGLFYYIAGSLWLTSYQTRSKGRQRSWKL